MAMPVRSMRLVARHSVVLQMVAEFFRSYVDLCSPAQTLVALAKRRREEASVLD